MAVIIGHELNNIIVPLEGFAELALHDAVAHEPVGPNLDEVKIAIGRIKSLASGLEILGETAYRLMPVSIGACLREGNGADPSLAKVDWQCRPSTLITVDAAHARRALQALAGLTARIGVQSALPGWRISREARGAARCAACGIALPRKDRIGVQAFTPHSVTVETLMHPFGPARAGRASRRLAIAVLVHSTHCAGGHLLLEQGAASLSLAFPIA